MAELNVFFATLCLVFLRGLQQQNVIHGNYLAATITPYFIAAAEVASVLFVVSIGWSAIPWVGTGGAIGVVCAMKLHGWMRARA